MLNIHLIKDVVLKSYRVIPDHFMPINMMILCYIPILAITVCAQYYFNVYAKSFNISMYVYYPYIYSYGSTIGYFITQMTIALLMARMIILHKHPSDNFYKTIFSKINLKMIGFIIVFINLIIVLCWVAFSLLIASQTLRESNIAIQILCFIGAAVIGLSIVYICFKSALVPQIIAVENKVGIRQSFAMMKGQLLNLMLIMVAVFILPNILILELGSVLMMKSLPMNFVLDRLPVDKTYVWIQGLWQMIWVYFAVIPNAACTYLYKHLKEKTSSI